MKSEITSPDCNIGGLILSGGMSSRMDNFPKALCRYGDTNFLFRIFSVMKKSGIQNATVVTGCHDEKIRSCIEIGAGLTFLFNPRWPQGMLSSIHCYVSEIMDSQLDGFIMIPVDHPFVKVETYRNILRKASRDRIVIPVFNDVKGHPVFWGRDFFDELLCADPSVGARQVNRTNKDKIIFVNTTDSGILKDIDTVEEYRKNFS